MKSLTLLFLLCASSFAHEQKMICKANGYSGDTVKMAIDQCRQHSRMTSARCATEVECTTYTTHCEAHGFAGDNVQDAINHCQQYSRANRQSCSAAVTCR